MSSEAQPRRFEVTIGPNTDPWSVPALQGLLGFEGVEVTEQPAVTSAPAQEVTREELEAVSSDLWGSPIYGSFASAYMGSLRRSAGQVIFYASDGTARLQLRRERQFNLPDTHDLPADLQTKQAIDEYLEAEVFGQSALPFTLRTGNLIANAGNDLGRPYRVLTPHMMTNHGLARFLRHNKLDAHTLHGTLGKGLDVLLEAAGIDRPSGVDREAAGPFVAQPEFRAIAEAAGLNAPKTYGILGGLRSNLEGQMKVGNPGTLSEVVIEGPATVRAASGIKWNRMTVASIQGSAHNRPRASRDVISFLSNFTAEYALSTT